MSSTVQPTPDSADRAWVTWLEGSERIPHSTALMNKADAQRFHKMISIYCNVAEARLHIKE